MALGNFRGVPEQENPLVRETGAKAQGKALGRPSALTDEQQRAVLAKRNEGVSLGTLAKEYGVSRAAIQRIERRAA